MRLEEIDKNFQLGAVSETDLEWICLHENTKYLRGVFFSDEENCFRRIPKAVADQTNIAAQRNAYNLAGGRICVRTDSPYVAVKCLAPFQGQMPHITIFAQYGFAVREDGDYKKMIAPTFDQLCATKDGRIAFEGIHYTKEKGKVHTYEIYLPLYGGAERIFFGVQAGASVEAAPLRTYQKPVVFYGSSITQGGCATRPDNDYVSMVCRWLEIEYINLGFGGGAKGERSIAEYIAEQDASVFVIDYDHNAPDPEHLQATHYPLYKTIREKKPETPIVFMSKPDYDYDPKAEVRAEIIRETCRRAKEDGDRKVEFIEGKTLFGEEDRSVCTVDCCHPNDIGFYRMAKTLRPVLEKYLKN